MSVDRPPKRRESKRKSEVVTVRLDPKLKYLAELGARRQRRTLSSFIEWALEDALSRVYPSYTDQGGMGPSFADKTSSLWDVDEPDRFAKLALEYPDLLDHEEQRIWKLISECGLLWRGKYSGPQKVWRWEVMADSLIWERLREHWETFRKVARGEEPSSGLPTWQKEMPTAGREDLDDEIPF
jgi:hypothetical protein